MEKLPINKRNCSQILYEGITLDIGGTELKKGLSSKVFLNKTVKIESSFFRSWFTIIKNIGKNSDNPENSDNSENSDKLRQFQTLKYNRFQAEGNKKNA